MVKMTEDNNLYTSVNPIPKPEKAIRLKGKAMEQLRRDCFTRDKGLCQKCGKFTDWNTGHMSHIKSRGAGGSDILDNVKWKCAFCHIVREHTLAEKD